MMLYLIKSGLCLAIVLGIYHLLLEREKMLAFNRYYLLFGLGFSFVVPFITVDFAVDFMGSFIGWAPIEVADGAGTTIIELASPPDKAIIGFDNNHFVIGCYLLVAGVFFLRFSYRLTRLLRKAYQHKKVSYQSAILVLIKEKVLPHTFWNFIFINEGDYQQQDIEPELFTHELAHVHQRHSFDILLIEALQVLFWFNPFLIPYKKAIQLNHEFLADAQVIKSHRQVKEYQHLLLDKAASNKIYLASNLNYLVTKKRLTMMTKNTSRTRGFLFASTTIPLFLCLIMLFGCKATAQETSGETKMEEQEMKDAYFKNVTIVREAKDGQKIYKPYADLSAEEKKAIPPPPGLTLQGEIIPLPEGTMLNIEEDGKILLEKNMGFVPPPPPKAPHPPNPPKASKVKAPKAPKQAKMPKEPKAPKAPKAMKEAKAMKELKEPREPKPAIAPIPPPPPPAPPLHIKELAKEGATFMKDGKEISAKEAIQLAEKQDSGYSIRVKKGGDGTKATVYFQKHKGKAY